MLTIELETFSKVNDLLHNNLVSSALKLEKQQPYFCKYCYNLRNSDLAVLTYLAAEAQFGKIPLISKECMSRVLKLIHNDAYYVELIKQFNESQDALIKIIRSMDDYFASFFTTLLIDEAFND